MHWNIEIADEAARRNASVLLIGSTGNLSISAGGISHLRQVHLQNGCLEWWRQSRRIGGLSWRKWQEIGKISLGPLLPRSVYRLLLVMANRRPDQGFSVPVLRAPYRDRAEHLLLDFYSDIRPPKDYYDFRRTLLLKRENAEKMTSALWGLDVRDPTGDRRLIELCLSLPADQLVSLTDFQRRCYGAKSEASRARTGSNCSAGKMSRNCSGPTGGTKSRASSSTSTISTRCFGDGQRTRRPKRRCSHRIATSC
jgi:hypothetical protein